jgi:hypothetical protein
MGRRKINDGKVAKQIRGPGRKSKKQGEPTFPKELLQTGKKKFFLFFPLKYSRLDSNEKKTLSSRSKKRFVFYFVSFSMFSFCLL